MQRELAQTKKQSAQQRAGVAHQQVSTAPSQVVVARNGNEVIIPPPQPPAGASMPVNVAFSPPRDIRSSQTAAELDHNLEQFLDRRREAGFTN